MKDISFELEILSHYYDSEIIVDHMLWHRYMNSFIKQQERNMSIE